MEKSRHGGIESGRHRERKKTRPNAANERPCRRKFGLTCKREGMFGGECNGDATAWIARSMAR